MLLFLCFARNQNHKRKMLNQSEFEFGEFRNYCFALLWRFDYCAVHTIVHLGAAQK